MADSKTKPTGASVDEYIASRASRPQQADDCRALVEMLGRVTGEAPYMWGPSIVGFGSYRYAYASGHSGEAPLAGFAIRGRDLVLYVTCEGETEKALLARLGKHRMGKSCLYFREFADVDPQVLERIAASSVADLRRLHP